MWFIKRKRNLAFSSNQEFPAHLDLLIERLKELHLTEPAQELHVILHESAWTTSSELLGEIKQALLRLRARHRDELPGELDREIRSCIDAI